MGVNRFEFEIWKLEVAYERHIEKIMQKTWAIRTARVVYDFIKSFPEKRFAKDFYITDVQDWAVLRGRGRKPITLRKDLQMLHKFFTWVQSQGVACANPVVLPPEPHRIVVSGYIALEQLRNLQASAHHPMDAAILELLLAGKRPQEIGAAVGLRASQVSWRWKKLRKRAQFPSMTQAVFYRAYQKLCFRLGERYLGMSANPETPDSKTPAHTLNTSETSATLQTHLLVN